MADWVYVMPPVKSSRRFTSVSLAQADAVSLFNQVNGIWARVNGNHIDFGLSDSAMMTLDMAEPDRCKPSDPMVGDWIPNPFDNDLLDLVEARVRAVDLE